MTKAAACAQPFPSAPRFTFALLAVTIAVSGSTGEVTLQGLQAQIQAMREAYEGRIANLEGELQKVRSERAEANRRTEVQQGIERALGKDPGLIRDLPERDARNTILGGDLAVKGSSQLTLGGYTEFNYIDRGDRTSSFDQNRTVLEMNAQVHEKINLYLEMEYEHGAIIAGAEDSDGELELEQAWVDFEVLPQLVFRAGMILTPLGRYNLYHEGWINNFVDRPLVNRRIAPTTWFEEGVGFHGQLLDNETLGLSYETYLFNPGRADGITPGGGFRGIRNEGNTPIYDSQKAGAMRLALEPARSAQWFADFFELGFSGYVSGYSGVHDPAAGKEFDGGTVTLAALDLTWERGHFGFKSEAAWGQAGRNRANSTYGFDQQEGWGFYSEASYKFWPSFLNQTPFASGFKRPELIGAVRFDYVDPALDNFDQRDLRRLTLGLSYRPLPRVVFKFDYQFDFSPSDRAGTTLSDSGDRDRTDAFLFGAAVGF